MAYKPVERQDLASVFRDAQQDLMVTQAENIVRSESGELRLVMTCINFLRNLVLCSRDFALSNGIEFNNKVVEAYLIESGKRGSAKSEFNPVGLSLNLSFCVLKALALKTSNITPSGLEAIFRRTVPNFSAVIAESLKVYNYSTIKPTLLLALYTEAIDHLSSGNHDALAFVRLIQGEYPDLKDKDASYLSTQINMMFKISGSTGFPSSVYMNDALYNSPEASYRSLCQLLIRNVDIWLSDIIDEQKSTTALTGESGIQLIQNLARTTSQLLADELDLAKSYFTNKSARSSEAFKRSPFNAIEKNFTERVSIYRSLNASSFDSFIKTVNYVNREIFQELAPDLKTGSLDYDAFTGDVTSVCSLVNSITVLLKSNMHALSEYFIALEAKEDMPQYVNQRHLRTSSDLTELNKNTISSVVANSNHVINSLINSFLLPKEYATKSWFSSSVTQSVLGLASRYYSKFDDKKLFEQTIVKATDKLDAGLNRFFDSSPLYIKVKTWTKDDQATTSMLKAQLIASVTGHVLDLYKGSFVASIFNDDLVDNYLNTLFTACGEFLKKIETINSSRFSSMTPAGRLTVLQSVMNGFAKAYTDNIVSIAARLNAGEIQRYDLYPTIFGLNAAVSDKRKVMETMADFMLDAMDRLRVRYTMVAAVKKTEGSQSTPETLSSMAEVEETGGLASGVKRRTIRRG